MRSKSKGEYLENLFQNDYGKDRFSFVIVEDMQKVSGKHVFRRRSLSFGYNCSITSFLVKDGAFDEVVVGMDAVEHTASPVTVMSDDPQGAYIRMRPGTLYSPAMYMM